MARFLRNTWYVAAWSGEVKPSELLPRRLLDEPVVMYRKPDGSVAALADRCPHRFAPLHRGKLSGDAIECPYHGLQFDSTGKCILNPHGPIPAAARVKSYLTVERYSAIWIWMGDPQKADPAAIPKFEFLVPEDWYVGTGYLSIAAHYELVTDNIMDLSHIEFLHPMFASDAVRAGKVESSQDGDTVWSKRYITAERLPGFLMQAFSIPAGHLADRWLDVRWNVPAQIALFSGAVVNGAPREAGIEAPSAHLLTPESGSSTHYFYAISFARAAGPVGAERAEKNVRYLRGPFESEDKPILEAVARNMEGRDFWDMKPLLLAIDGAAVRARRTLEERIAAESFSDGG